MHNLSVESVQVNVLSITALEEELASLREENVYLRDRILDLELGDDRGEVKYVGTKSRSLFHRPSCKWLRDVDSKTLVTWTSHEAAVRMGRKPCKTCRA